MSPKWRNISGTFSNKIEIILLRTLYTIFKASFMVQIKKQAFYFKDNYYEKSFCLIICAEFNLSLLIYHLYNER